jgi:dinuclear metal center YbgI/SA1388 family protein
VAAVALTDLVAYLDDYLELANVPDYPDAWNGLQVENSGTVEKIAACTDACQATFEAAAAHLPLDAHPEVGNNIELARGIGLNVEDRFGEYEGQAIGFWGELQVTRGELSARLERFLGSEPFLIAAGPEAVRRVGVVTGGGASMISQARDAGLDTFVTGEGPHHSYFDAQEWGLNVLFAGHYATETLGVKALAGHVAEKYGLDWEFIDHPTGL